MAVCFSCKRAETKAREEQTRRSQEIDKVLHDDSRRLQHEYKMLLLGLGNSGKTTIMKQMRILYQNGYTAEELTLVRHTIYKDVVESAKTIVEVKRHLNIEAEHLENSSNCDYILQYSLGTDSSGPLGERMAIAIAALWSDSCIPKVLGHPDGLWRMNMDTAAYFFDDIHRIAAADYTPTEADVLRARTRKGGINATTFQTRLMTVHMFDISRTPGERKKWIHYFDDTNVILFCAALDEYDRMLPENCQQSPLMDSIVLFDSIVNSRWFKRTKIILFLNKTDLFKAKLPKKPLKDYFPDYTGDNDFGQAANYLLDRFLQVNRGDSHVYAQYVRMDTLLTQTIC